MSASTVLALRRNSPLTPSEHRALADAHTRWSRWGWRHLAGLEIVGLDGVAPWRAVLAFHFERPDVDLADLPDVVRMMDQFTAAVPRAVPVLGDPGALFARRQGRFAVAASGDAPIERLPHGWTPPDIARLSFSSADHITAPMLVEDEQLADLLQVIERCGAQPDLMRAGAGAAVGFRASLPALVEDGICPTAACLLLADLHTAGLASAPAAAAAAEGLHAGGDARERGAVRRLMAALERPTPLEPTLLPREIAPPDWAAVETIGRRLLAAARPPDSEQDTGVRAAGAWRDDLEDDDLLLVMDEAPGGELSALLDDLSGAPEIGQAEPLARGEGFPAEVLERLSGHDSLVGGICALLACGVWSFSGLPGMVARLVQIADSSAQSSVRALAIHALAVSGRPDAIQAVLQLARDPLPEIARAAVGCLGSCPGPDARRAVREAARMPGLEAQALTAMAMARDPGGFPIAEELCADRRVEVRRAAAAALERLGGRRALRKLRELYTSDTTWEVRLAAAGGLARCAPPEALLPILGAPDPDLAARTLLAIGEADRIEATGWLLQHLSHARPGVRAAAVGALGLLEITCGPLLKALDDPDAGVVLAAISALERCGDSRALAPLQTCAARAGEIGEAARRALVRGRRLRLPEPVGRFNVRARSTDPLGEAHQRRIAQVFGFTRPRITAQGFSCTGTLTGAPIDALRELALAIEQIDGEIHGLRWSVQDDLCAVRRLSGQWILSVRRGRVVRDAGWFEIALPDFAERPPLLPDALRAPLEQLPPMPLPVAPPPVAPAVAASPAVGSPVVGSPVGSSTAGPAVPVAPPPEEGLLSYDDEPPEQELTLSDFLEEVTAGAPSQPPPDPPVPDLPPAEPDDFDDIMLETRDLATSETPPPRLDLLAAPADLGALDDETEEALRSPSSLALLDGPTGDAGPWADQSTTDESAVAFWGENVEQRAAEESVGLGAISDDIDDLELDEADDLELELDEPELELDEPELPAAPPLPEAPIPQSSGPTLAPWLPGRSVDDLEDPSGPIAPEATPLDALFTGPRDAGSDPWNDLLDPARATDALRTLATSAITDADRIRVHAWLRSGDPVRQVAACRVVETLGDPAPIAQIVSLLSHARGDVRSYAVRAIGAVGDRDVLSDIVRLTDDPDADVRAGVREAIAAISGPPGPT